MWWLQPNFYDALTLKYNGVLYENVFVTKNVDLHKNPCSTVAQAYST